jgi:RNA polymerase sigma-70 factor, ECF subfamily
MIEEPTEEQLLRRARAGDRAASVELGSRLKARVQRFVARHLADPMAVDEIVQDTLVALHMNLHRLDEPAKVRPFVFRVARNLCCSELRRRGRLAPVTYVSDAGAHDATPSRQAPPDEAVYWLLAWQEVRAAVDGLPEPHRTTVILLVEEGLSHDQIADAMSTSVGTVKSRVHHSRKLLVRALRPDTRAALGLAQMEEDPDD